MSGDNMQQLVSIVLPMILMNTGGNIGGGGLLLRMMIPVLVIILSELLNVFNVTNLSAKYYAYFNKSTVYKLKGTVTYKNNVFFGCNMPLPFKAVMSRLYDKITITNNKGNVEGGKKSRSVKYNIVEESTWNGPIKLIVFSQDKYVYDMGGNIELQQERTEKRSDKDDFTYYTYVIKLSPKDGNMKSIISFIDECQEVYDEELSKTTDNKLKIYTLNGFAKESLVPIYSETWLHTTKSFDNMFFEEKEMLMKRIDAFQSSNNDRFERLGLPKTMGMMFHGEPGTGKTSAIKAIARYTQRHIIVIPVKNVNSAEKLRALFLEERLNCVKVPMRKRLYIFEEIDCSQWKNIVMARGTAAARCSEQHLGAGSEQVEELAECIKSALDGVGVKTKGAKEKDDEKFDITLGDILELLDGMVEMPERMIIFTSNFPEHIDPALLRHGRCDLRIKFKKMTRENVKDMYRLWFGKDIPLEYVGRMKDYTFSQAEIGNLFSTYDEAKILKGLVMGDC